MSEEIRIENATESDISTIAGLLQELVDVVDSVNGISIQAATLNLRTLFGNTDSFLLVARNRNTTIGFINVSVRQTLLHNGPSGLIDELVVSKSHQGQGIGRSLVHAAVEKCRHLGCCELEVSTEKTNTTAREFYRQCGFDEDSVLLELQLDTGNTG